MNDACEGEVVRLTYEDLTRLCGLRDFVGTAHLRVADSAQDEDDELRAAVVVVRRGFVLLSSTTEIEWMSKKVNKTITNRKRYREWKQGEHRKWKKFYFYLFLCIDMSK